MIDFKIINLDSTDSTQNYLTELDKDNSAQEYLAVKTDCQTRGRGQANNIWESEKDKNLTFSLLLRPDFLNPAEQFFITQTVSLAIVDLLTEYGLKNVKIKWPNDIYINENKICGFLTQNKVMGNGITASYIGIGLNINQTEFHFAPNPASFALETSKQYDTEIVFKNLLQCISVRYNQLKNGRRNEIQQQYLENLLFLGQMRPYIYLNEKILAKSEGVNSFGHLKLRKSDGGVIFCELKTLKFCFGA